LITLDGVLARDTAQQAPGAVHAAIVRWAPTAVFLDVARVSGPLDSPSLGTLLASHRAAHSVSVTLALVNPSDRLYQQLRDRNVAGVLCPNLAVIDVDQAAGIR
jgi:ABC-type transporter Mla MlaB component